MVFFHSTAHIHLFPDSSSFPITCVVLHSPIYLACSNCLALGHFPAYHTHPGRITRPDCELGLAPPPEPCSPSTLAPTPLSLYPRRAPELVSEDKPAEKPAATGGDVTVSEDDVKLVMAQTDCSEEKAREALKAENGDLINASESARRSAARRVNGGGGGGDGAGGRVNKFMIPYDDGKVA